MKYSSWVTLACIVLLGGFLRFYQISSNPPGLYIDEAAIALNAHDILTTGHDQYGTFYPLSFRSFGDYKMPGYIYLTALSMSIFGATDFAVRFPSAFFGTATIVVLFFLMQSLLQAAKKTKPYATQTALISAGLLAILPWHIHFSRGGFETSVALCIYLTAILVGIKYWLNKRTWFLVGAVILLALSQYTYHTYRIIAPLTAIVTLSFAFYKKHTKKQMLIGFLCFMLASLPLILFSFTAAGHERLSQTSAFTETPASQLIPPPLADGLMFVSNYLNLFSITSFFHYGDQINRHQIEHFGLLYLWQLPFIIAGIYFLTKTNNQLLRFTTLFLLLIAPLAPSIAKPVPHTLRFLLAVIPLTMLTSLGILQMLLIKKRFITWFFGGIGVIAVFSFIWYLNAYFITYPKDTQLDWGGKCKEVAMVIKNEAKNYDHVIVDKNLPCWQEYFSFYVPDVRVTIVPVEWKKPTKWEKGSTLLIRTYYGNKNPDGLIETVHLTNVNRDIFAQFIKL